MASTGAGCSTCSDEIDCCELCNRPDCPVAICFDCVNVVLGQAIEQPHTHGG